MLPLNIRVDMNCQPTWVAQNAIPEEQELILQGGVIMTPPRDKVRLRATSKRNALIVPVHIYLAR